MNVCVCARARVCVCVCVCVCLDLSFFSVDFNRTGLIFFVFLCDCESKIHFRLGIFVLFRIFDFRFRLHGFWGEPKHDVANQAGAEGVDHLAPTACQKTSEKRRQIHANYNINSYLLKTQDIKVSKGGEQISAVFLSPNEGHTKQYNKEFTSLEKQIESFIKYITPKSNVHGEIKMMENALKTTYSRLKRLDSKPLEMTNPDGARGKSRRGHYC